MQICISILTRNRTFSKAIRQVLQWYRPHLDAFDEIDFDSVKEEKILFGITTEEEPEFLRKVENKDAYLQFIVGCRPCCEARELSNTVLTILEKVFEHCPFMESDRRKAGTFLSDLQALSLNKLDG